MSRWRCAATGRLLFPAVVLCLGVSGHGGAQDRSSLPGEAGITVEVDGQRLALPARPGSVADALSAAGVSLGEHDECSPPQSEAVLPGMGIVVHRVVVTTVVERERVPARTRVLPTRRIRPGLTMIQEHPQDGLKERGYRETRRDGKIVARRLLRTRVLVPARDRVILVGGREARLPSRGGYFTGRRVLSMVASGYPAMVCGTGRTYLGLKARKGIVAVDPRVIPLGARVYVQGYGQAVAGDIGSAIKGNRIDLCFGTFREAARYGMKKVKVWILSR